MAHVSIKLSTAECHLERTLMGILCPPRIGGVPLPVVLELTKTKPKWMRGGAVVGGGGRERELSLTDS